MFESVIELISQHTGINKETISADSYFTSDLGLNSYDLVTLVCAFEESFGICVPDDSIREFQQVKDVINFITISNIQTT